MANSSTKTSWYGRLNKRLKGTGDSEPEQAKLRLAIGFIILVYIALPWGEDERLLQTVTSYASLIVLIYYSGAMAIFGAIVLNPRPSQIRRICGSALDMGSLSILMFNTGAETVPLFLIYLWVILGNGFRFGLMNLYVSQVIAIVGYSVVVIWGEYWQEHRSFGISLLLMLALLPLYAAFLIKKLHAAVDMAKQANEAKSRFLANMSHELRTPLNGVIGVGDLLRETRLSFEQKELVNTMYSSAKTLLELIENVLDIAKIEAGKILIESKDFDLHGLVNSVVYMLSPLGNKKDLSISSVFDPQTPFALKGDQQHLRQVLINLVNNAIKFTEEGAIVVAVRQVDGTEKAPRIRFEITDTGIGMTDEAISLIFENFTQADASTSRAYGGTGLGTTISKELVELMDGTIGVYSEVGKGTTFWFEIPFVSSVNPDTSISDNHVLLLAADNTASVISPSLAYWQVDFDSIKTSSRALTKLVQAREDGNPYETMLVDQSCLEDIDAIQFAQMVKSEGLLEDTSLVLVNSSGAMIDSKEIDHYYTSILTDPEDKRMLFNSLHAAQSVSFQDNKIITLAEHYAKQAGLVGLNILVAEDNQVNQQVIEGILRHAGHNTLIASTGEQALESLSEQHDQFDMAILDMNMPEVSGVEVVKMLRFMDTSARLPVIMLTADATPEAKEASLTAGANRFLTKPIDARALLECIASLSKGINRARGERPTLKRESRLRTLSNFEESEWYDNIVLHELDLLGDSADFLISLIRNFEKQGSDHIVKIKQAMYDDYLEYRESLHALKGSATELGAGQLVDACIEGESLKPYDMGSEKINQASLKIEDIFNKTVTALAGAVTVNPKSLSGKD